MTVFVDRPYVPMSNNEAERALRDAVLGRKSYYGSRALWSGYLTSWLFTIYATLEQNGIDPHRWMGEYLHACAKNNGLPPPDKELQRFLPWNYKQIAQPQEDAQPTNEPQGEHKPNPVPISVSIIPEQQFTPGKCAANGLVSLFQNDKLQPGRLLLAHFTEYVPKTEHIH